MFETRNRLFWPAMASLAAFGVAGCHPSSDGGTESPPPASEAAIARFNPATGILPYPIDLFFSPTPGVPSDGTGPSETFARTGIRLRGIPCWPQ